MTTNWEDLLSKKADDVKEPTPLPVGPYRMEVEDNELVTSTQKGTPGIQVMFKIIEALDGVDEDALAEVGDISKKSVRDTFWITPDSEYRFIEFVKKCGVETEGKTLGELIPEIKGQEVVGVVSHRTANDPNDTRIFTEVKSYNSI